MSTLAPILFLVPAASGPETTRAATLREPLPVLDAAVSALSPDGDRLAIAAPPDRVLVLALPSGELEFELITGPGRPTCVAWKPDGSELAVLDRYGFVSVYDPIGGSAHLCIGTSSVRDAPDFGLRTVTYAAAGSVLISALGTPAEIFDAATGARIARMTTDGDALVTALAVDATGERVALGDESGRVTIRRTLTGKSSGLSLRVPRGDECVGVHSLDFHPDGSRLAIGGGDCRARVWDLDRSASVREYSHCDDDAASYRSARGIAWTGRAGSLRVLDVASGTVVLERRTKRIRRPDRARRFPAHPSERPG